jgi:iron complex transport system substrate-binding protein
MKRLWLMVVAVIILLTCGICYFTSAAKPNDVTAVQAAGVPDRIVSLAPNLTEILFALGLDEKIIAVSSDSDYPPEAAKKAKAGTFWQPNLEAVIAARPDLVVTLGFEQQKNLAQRLNRIGYVSLTVNIEKVADLFGAIEKIGAATGSQPRAAELLRSIRANLDRLSALVAAGPKVKVLWVVQRQPLRVAGRETFANEMIELAGGENAIGPTLHKYPPIGSEQVYTCGAEVIIEPAMGRESFAVQQAGAFEYWGRFGNLPAVKNRRIYVVNADTVSRLGPRLYEGLETVAECLRPGLLVGRTK